MLAPVAGHDRVQPLDDRLGADVGGNLGAGIRLAVVGDLGHGAEPDRAGRERPAKQCGRLGVGARGRVDVRVVVVRHVNLLSWCWLVLTRARARDTSRAGRGRVAICRWPQAASELGVC